MSSSDYIKPSELREAHVQKPKVRKAYRKSGRAGQVSMVEPSLASS